jgi:hypothetical protein
MEVTEMAVAAPKGVSEGIVSTDELAIVHRSMAVGRVSRGAPGDLSEATGDHLGNDPWGPQWSDHQLVRGRLCVGLRRETLPQPGALPGQRVVWRSCFSKRSSIGSALGGSLLSRACSSESSRAPGAHLRVREAMPATPRQSELCPFSAFSGSQSVDNPGQIGTIPMQGEAL